MPLPQNAAPKQLKQPAEESTSILPAPVDHSKSILPQPLRLMQPEPNWDEHLRSFGDHRRTRQLIYDNVLQSITEMEPTTNQHYTLKMNNARYIDPEKFTRKQQKEALLGGQTLSRRIRGTWELYDNTTGQMIDQANKIIARVPFLTHRGTFINNGSEYTLTHQQRLKPGVYTRIKDNGELEAHANILPGKGVSHRYMLNPEKGVFQIKIGQATIPLMPLLKSMGVTDTQLREAWGNKLVADNYRDNDASTLKKLSTRVLRKKREGEPEDDEATTTQRLKSVFEAMEVDPYVTKRTLGREHRGMTSDAILDVTKKLLAVSRGEAKVDDRDHLAYQNFLGPEDLFAERIKQDHGRLRKQLLMKIALKGGTLDKMPSGALSPQIEHALLGSGLGQSIEEINPLEIFDKQSRITRMGEGGIASLDAIPEEARSVQPSHMGFMDSLRTPESFRAGVDVHMARGARKGKDGKIYTQLRDLSSGKSVWKSPDDIADVAVAFPGVLNKPQIPSGMKSSARAAYQRIQAGMPAPQDRELIKAYERLLIKPPKRVPVMKDGEITYVPRDEVDYELPSFEDAFSPLGNLVPIKSMVKGQRVAMASRMLTQALPLINPEAPLVRGAIPGSDKSFEEEYGKQMGAVHADKDGQVIGIKDGVIKVKFSDGTTDDIETYENFPFNRKTVFHQKPLVQPGDHFKAGQPLVRSNYTDDQGATALGVNARVAYMAHKGYNFEDAIVISEAMAKRFTSEHAYQHDVEVDEKTKIGKKAYASIFPGKYDKQMLSRLDDNGVIEVGQKVEFGQPLILAAQEKEHTQNKIHKKRQAGYSDVSVLWKHHDPGVVTDVVQGKKGPVVLVKSYSSMQVGDKMSGRVGDKGVVSAIVPDHLMPHDRDGKPFEVLLNPLGVISRTNPQQMVEAALGKVARHTGKPVSVKDFDDTEDMTEWALGELKKHGLSDTEHVVDPETGRLIPDIATGDRFFMKLHHTAEGKSQGRGSGGYTAEDAPSKGGDTGCFVGNTMIRSWPCEHDAGDRYRENCRHYVSLKVLSIEEMVKTKYRSLVLSCSPPNRYRSTGAYIWQHVTDHFEYHVDPTDLLDIELENGKVIQVTCNHLFFLKDGTSIIAGHLEEGMDLLEG